jgi:hypothetical protein
VFATVRERALLKTLPLVAIVMQLSSMFKKDFDHADFAVAARNEKLRY